MTHKDFDDQQLEKLLNNAPKLSDHRSKEEILKRLQADARLKDNPHVHEAIGKTVGSQDHTVELVKTSKRHKKRKMSWFISIASVFVFMIVVGGMLLSQQAGKELADMKTNTNTNSTLHADQQQNANNVMETSMMANHSRLMSLRTSVYEEDLIDATVFRIGLAGSAAESVPLTYVIPNDRVIDDFGDEKPTTLQLYTKYAPQIDEEAMGFSAYHPYKGELKEEGDKLVHVLPEDHDYDGTSAMVSMYEGSLKDTFSDYKEIALKNADGTAYTFSQVGEPSESIQLNGTVNHYNYFLYQETDGKEYLSPNFHQTFETVTEAILDMQNRNNDIYVPVIPEGVTYIVTEEEEGVVVSFDEPLDLTSLDPIRATQLVEGINLTAGSFDKKLLLENIVQEQWEGFDLTTYLPMPVGPNKQSMQ